MVVSRNACCVWDITIPEKEIAKDNLIKLFKLVSKSWTFQLEQGKKTDYRHYQCRISLKVKSRDAFGVLKVKGQYAPTSEENCDNDFYVCKDDTRIEGPWKDDDEEVYIPRQFRNLNLYPWQQYIVDSRLNFNDRHINVIFDPIGCRGKSTLASVSELQHNAIDLPPVNCAIDLMQITCNICMDTNNRTPGLIFLDMPRCVDKTQLIGLYSACEQIKKGKLYDMRYHYKKFWIDSPQIWVFTNELPNTSLLSKDRWQIWTITNNNELIRFEADAKASCNNSKRKIK